MINLTKLYTERAQSPQASKNYPELRKVVDKIRDKTSTMINQEAAKVKSEMPYKAKWILEELIKELQEAV